MGEYKILSECGCNACHSGPSEYCENGPYWHAEADRLRAALAEIAAMPRYSLPLPDNYVSSLFKRYDRALDIAETALAPAHD